MTNKFHIVGKISKLQAPECHLNFRRWCASKNVVSSSVVYPHIGDAYISVGSYVSKKRIPWSCVEFHIGKNIIEYAESYKHLGIVLDEFLNFENTAYVIVLSVSTTLEAIIGKFRDIIKTVCYTNMDEAQTILQMW